VDFCSFFGSDHLCSVNNVDMKLDFTFFEFYDPRDSKDARIRSPFTGKWFHIKNVIPQTDTREEIQQYIKHEIFSRNGLEYSLKNATISASYRVCSCGRPGRNGMEVIPPYNMHNGWKLRGPSIII
jgi:hypothetical protein